MNKNLSVVRGTTLRRLIKRTDATGTALPFTDETVSLVVTGRVTHTSTLETDGNEVDLYVSDETTAGWDAGESRYVVIREDSAGDKFPVLKGRLIVE